MSKINGRELLLTNLQAEHSFSIIKAPRPAIQAELPTGRLRTAWQVLWIFFEGFGLKPDDVQVNCDGVSGGEYAHIRWSSAHTKDPYSDVIVHEAEHLLHYLKPEHYGFKVRRGQERFVDVEFHHRELFAFACEAYSRVILLNGRNVRFAFAEKMRDDAFSFAQEYLSQVAALVLSAAPLSRRLADDSERHGDPPDEALEVGSFL